MCREKKSRCQSVGVGLDQLAPRIDATTVLRVAAGGAQNVDDVRPRRGRAAFCEFAENAGVAHAISRACLRRILRSSSGVCD